jgi:hypothetical protein
MDEGMKPAEYLLAASPSAVSRFLAAAISECTLTGRSVYDGPNMVEGLKAVNEAVHRLSGHMGDLLSGEPLTESRAAGIVEQLRPVPSGRLQCLVDRYLSNVA